MAPPIYVNTQQSVIQRHARLFLGASCFLAVGTATFTRTSKGILYFAQGASQTVHYEADFAIPLRSLTPALVNYAFNGADGGGVTIASATPLFTVGTLALTSATLGITRSTYPASGTAAAPTVVDLLAPTNLALAVSANIVAPVLTPANPSLLPFSTDQLLVELNIVTPATSTFNFYGVILDLALLP